MPVLPSIEPFIGTPGTPSNANFYPGDPNAVAKAAQYLAGGGNKAKMCVAQHVWKSMQIVGGEIKVLYSSKIVDRADGWAAFDQ